MKTTIHKANTRGHANHGWLESYHSFSFAGYYNPERMRFGLLRVLNDDYVAAGKGFGAHPHDNMEIISIPLEGDLEHNDSMGTSAVIRKNDVQVMSAGTGIIHSEYNKSGNDPVRFLQIWIFPKLKNIAPRYDQRTYDPLNRVNKLQPIVSPMESHLETVKINQDAYLTMSKLENDKDLEYILNNVNHGVYVFLLEGEIKINDNLLSKRDAVGIEAAEKFRVAAKSDAEILFIEVPMN